jgi:hypothetical protein
MPLTSSPFLFLSYTLKNFLYTFSLTVIDLNPGFGMIIYMQYGNIRNYIISIIIIIVSVNKALVCKAVNFTITAGLLLTVYLISHVLVDMIA